jgi:hypothetical protein
MQSVLRQKSYSLNEFAHQNAIGLTTVHGEIKEAVLRRAKLAGEIITAEDAKAWQESSTEIRKPSKALSLLPSQQARLRS